jgi:hypothetical protein
MHSFISTWKAYQPAPPYVLNSDRALLGRPDLTVRIEDWSSYINNPNFGAPETKQLNVDLLPMPYVGDLESATIYLLMLNPGLAPSDYYGEHMVPEYRSALLWNLRQVPGSEFIFLNPAFSWHGGFLYWHAKLGKLIGQLANELHCTYGEARELMQKRVAAVELVPYHSATFGLPGSVLTKLASAELARQYVHDVLVPKAMNGKCLIVVTRAVKHWRLPKHKCIVAYSASEARGAHLSKASRGGASILEFMAHEARGAA